MSRKTEIKSNLKRKTSLPPQLQRKVSSGAISRSQALQTAQERQTLKKAFGSDWRTQVFGKGGAKGNGGPFGSTQTASQRSQALERARAKLGGGVGGAKGVQGTLNAPVRGIGPRKIRKRGLRY